MKKFRIISVMCAAVISAAVFAGCDNNNEGSGGEGTTASQSSETSGTQVSVGANDMFNVGDQEIITETRPIEDGDDYAINKINNKSPADSLPGGYVLADYSEKDQGKLYTNGKSGIIIRAYNYKEDLQDMAIWADNACAIMTIANITSAQDTVFEDPENVKICGFDGIRYDYQKIQYDFIPDENDPDGEPVKTEIFRYSSRVYYFYSEQDAYAILFDTMESDWEEQSALFEEFVADLEVTKTDF